MVNQEHSRMKQLDENSLKATGAGGGFTAAVVEANSVEANSNDKRARGLARGLTLLTICRNHQYRLAVKTTRGILDVPDAARRLNIFAPATMDDLLQNEEGPSLTALVDAALSSHAADPVFCAEAKIEFGPVVTRPEKSSAWVLITVATPEKLIWPFPNNRYFLTSTTIGSMPITEPLGCRWKWPGNLITRSNW